LVEADNQDMEAAGLNYKFVGSIEKLKDRMIGTYFDVLLIEQIPLDSNMQGVRVGAIAMTPDENGHPAKWVVNPKIYTHDVSFDGGQVLENDGGPVSLQNKAHMELQMTLLYATGNEDQEKLKAFYEARDAKPVQSFEPTTSRPV
jgi:hypothetical protein